MNGTENRIHYNFSDLHNIFFPIPVNLINLGHEKDSQIPCL